MKKIHLVTVKSVDINFEMFKNFDYHYYSQLTSNEKYEYCQIFFNKPFKSKLDGCEKCPN